MCRILFPRRLFVRIKCNSVRRFPVRFCVKEERFAHPLFCAEEAACIATSMPHRFARALHIHSRQAYRSQLLSTFLCHLDNLEPSLVAVSFKILLMHSLTSSHYFLSNCGSKISVKLLRSPQAMAVHTFNCTPSLLIVMHYSQSTALITNPHPLLPSSLFASIAFHFPVFLTPFSCDLRFSLSSQIRHLVRLWTVFSEDELHVVVNFPPRDT